MWSVHKASSLPPTVTRCPRATWFPPTDAVVPDRIPRGLPTGCSSPSTAPARLHTRGPPFGPRCSAVPRGGSSPGPPAAPRAALPGPRLRPGGIRMPCLPRAASAAAPGAAPWPHGEICSARCPRAAGNCLIPLSRFQGR